MTHAIEILNVNTNHFQDSQIHQEAWGKARESKLSFATCSRSPVTFFSRVSSNCSCNKHNILGNKNQRQFYTQEEGQRRTSQVVSCWLEFDFQKRTIRGKRFWLTNWQPMLWKWPRHAIAAPTQWPLLTDWNQHKYRTNTKLRFCLAAWSQSCGTFGNGVKGFSKSLSTGKWPAGSASIHCIYNTDQVKCSLSWPCALQGCKKKWNQQHPCLQPAAT